MKTKRLCRILLPGLALGVLVCTGFATVQAGNPAPPYPDKAKLRTYRDKDGEEHPIKTPADWKIRRDHILANMQLAMGALSDAKSKVPLDIKVIEEEKTDKYVRKLISF